MKKTALFLFSFCILNSVFAQWNYVSGSSGSIYYNGGNVGIATNNPQAALDVNGIVHTNNMFLVDIPTANTQGAWFRGPSSGSGNILLQADAGAGVAFWISGATHTLKIGGSGGSEPSQGAINIDYNGNVAVGTLNTGSGYKFAVDGSAVFDGVTVTTFAGNNPKAAPWADYVFNKGHQLPSLQSVAAYIAANHHLAGIPTTADVQKNGLDLGTNQAKLLEKIEELTLYTIDLQKQADQSRTENEKLMRLLQTQSQQLAVLQHQVEKLQGQIDVKKNR